MNSSQGFGNTNSSQGFGAASSHQGFGAPSSHQGSGATGSSQRPDKILPFHHRTPGTQSTNSFLQRQANKPSHMGSFQEKQQLEEQEKTRRDPFCQDEVEARLFWEEHRRQYFQLQWTNLQSRLMTDAHCKLVIAADEQGKELPFNLF